MTGLAFALLIAGLIGWEYTPALRGGFVYEDFHTVDVCADSPVRWNLDGRRLTLATWCAQLARQQPPIAFHLVNLGLHLLVTALVGALVWTLTRSSGAAWLAAAFFGVNAVNVEAVAYLSGRSELIAAIGVLGACLAALSRRWWLVPPLLLLGWWGKESAIVAVLLVPLCLWYQRGRGWLWGLSLAAVILVAELVIRTSAWWPDGLSRLSWARAQMTALVRVIGVSLVPLGQTVDYDYARVPLAMSIVAALGLVASGVWMLRHGSRLMQMGVAWVGCAALPRLLVPTPRSVFPEHQFYLPLVGMTLLVASMWRETRV